MTKTMNAETIDEGVNNIDNEIDIHAKYNNENTKYSDFVVKNIKFKEKQFEGSHYYCDLYIIMESTNKEVYKKSGMGASKEAYKQTEIKLNKAKKIISKIDKYNIDIKHTNSTKELHLKKLLSYYVFEYTNLPDDSSIHKARLNEESINGKITNITETKYNLFTIHVSTDNNKYKFKATYDEISKLRKSLNVSILIGKKVELTSDARAIELSDFTLKNENDIYLVDEFNITPLHYINSPIQITLVLIIFSLIFISISVNILLTIATILSTVLFIITIHLINEYRFREYYDKYVERHRF